MDTSDDDEGLTDRETNVLFVPHPRVIRKPVKHVEPRLPLPAPVRGKAAPAPLSFRGKRPGTTPGIDYDRTPALQRIERDFQLLDEDITKRIMIG
jgi:hypothetical protein